MWLKLISFASNLRCCLSWEVPTPSVDLHRHARLSHAIQTLLQDCSLKLWNQSEKYGRLYSSMRQKNSWWTHPNLASIGNITAGNRDIAQCSKPEGIRDLCKLQPCESCYWGQKSPPTTIHCTKCLQYSHKDTKQLCLYTTLPPPTNKNYHQNHLQYYIPSIIYIYILHFAHFLVGEQQGGLFQYPEQTQLGTSRLPKPNSLTPAAKPGADGP